MQVGQGGDVRIQYVLLCMVLAGCTATGRPYTEHPASATPVPAGESRIVLIRPEYKFDSTEPTTVMLDGVPLPQLLGKGYLVHATSPGHHELSTSSANVYLACKLDFDASDGQTHYFLVATRSEHTSAGLLPLLLPTWTTGGYLLATGMSEVLPALESQGKRCGGTFSVAEISAATAGQLLPKLRESAR